MQFTIRELLLVTVIASLGVGWWIDRNTMRRERAESAKREAELTSRAKMWENETNRAEKRGRDSGERFQALNFALNQYGMLQSDLIDAKNHPRYLPRTKKLIIVDGDPKK